MFIHELYSPAEQEMLGRAQSAIIDQYNPTDLKIDATTIPGFLHDNGRLMAQ